MKTLLNSVCGRDAYSHSKKNGEYGPGGLCKLVTEPANNLLAFGLFDCDDVADNVLIVKINNSNMIVMNIFAALIGRLTRSG